MTPGNDSRRLDALHLFGLSCAAIAQPIFDLLGRNGDFFVSSRSGTVEILVLTFVLIVGIPALLVLIELAAGAINERLRRGVHLTLVAVLMIAIAVPIARHLLPPRDTLILLVSVSLGLLGAVAYARKAGARQIVSWLAALSVLAPANFLLHSDVTRILLPSSAPAVHAKVAADTPIVLAIFDELPLSSLLDEHLQIDAARYPNFARLASMAYWFRNATSVSEATTNAVPAILTGRKPDLSLLATARDHPESIYSWLAQSYKIESREPVTAMCPAATCVDREDRPHAAKLTAMAADVAIILGHTILPPALAAHTLPRIDQAWHGFGSKGDVRGLGVMALPDEDGSTRSIAITSSGKALYVLHFLLPHVPWHYLPGGHVYGLSQDIPGLGASEQWVTDPPAVIEGYQRHLLQVGYVDRVLGDLLGRLEAAGIYDRALVIVAADHGCSFRPGDNRRQVTPTNWPDLLRVPLIVKLPQQHTGVTSDRPVQTIDILPTIAAVLHAKLPFSVDGVSLVPDTDRPPVKRTAIYGSNLTLVVPPDLTGLQEAAARKASLFGSGADTRKLFGRGRFWKLVDQPTSQLQPAQSSEVRAVLVEPDRFAKVAPESGSLPALVAGSVSGSGVKSGDAYVAIGVNGVVRAVAPLAGVGQDDAFQIVLPEAAFTSGHNTLEVLIVDGPEEHPVAVSASLTGNEHRLVSTGTGERLESTGQAVPVKSGALTGFVDKTSNTDMDGYLSVWGWVVDFAYAGPPGILVFADGKEVASARPTADRPDIVTAMANPQALRSGYVVRVPLAALAGTRTIRIFGVSGRGVASELSYPADFPYLSAMRYTLVGGAAREHFESPERDVVTIEPHAIQGYVDSWSWSRVGDDDYLSVSGWAADPSSGSPIYVVLVAGDRPVAAIRPVVPRPDVAQVLKNERVRRSGYTFRIKLDRSFQERPLRMFGISARGIASELTNAPGVHPGPAPWAHTE